MIRLAADNDFNHDIIRGVLRRNPAIDIVTLYDVGLSDANDPTVLEWAASENRVLLTHDVTTMTRFAYERVRNNLPMPGIIEVSQGAQMGVIIKDILLIAECSFVGEWEGQIIYLPLR